MNITLHNISIYTCPHDIDMKRPCSSDCMYPCMNSRSHKSLTAQSWRRGRGAMLVELSSLLSSSLMMIIIIIVMNG